MDQQPFGGFSNVYEYAAAHGLLVPFQQVNQFTDIDFNNLNITSQHLNLPLNTIQRSKQDNVDVTTSTMEMEIPPQNFNPSFYNPFQVKHRRRTTRNQFKVLEKAFNENPKPNSNVRLLLAEKLGMTPRGIQIWFQNRRAKAKTQKSKPHDSNNSLDMNDYPSTPPPSYYLDGLPTTPITPMTPMTPMTPNTPDSHLNSSPEIPNSPERVHLTAQEWSDSLNLDAQAAAKRCPTQRRTRSKPLLPTLKMPTPQILYQKVLSGDNSNTFQFISPIESDFSLTPSPMTSFTSSPLISEPLSSQHPLLTEPLLTTPVSASCNGYFLSPPGPEPSDMVRRNSCPPDFLHSFIHLGLNPDQQVAAAAAAAAAAAVAVAENSHSHSHSQLGGVTLGSISHTTPTLPMDSTSAEMYLSTSLPLNNSNPAFQCT